MSRAGADPRVRISGYGKLEQPIYPMQAGNMPDLKMSNENSVKSVKLENNQSESRISNEERKKLCEQIVNLPGHVLYDVIELIRKEEPESLKYVDSQCVFDTATMGDEVLTHIKELIKNYNFNKQSFSDENHYLSNGGSFEGLSPTIPFDQLMDSQDDIPLSRDFSQLNGFDLTFNDDLGHYSWKSDNDILKQEPYSLPIKTETPSNVLTNLPYGLDDMNKRKAAELEHGDEKRFKASTPVGSESLVRNRTWKPQLSPRKTPAPRQDPNKRSRKELLAQGFKDAFTMNGFQIYIGKDSTGTAKRLVCGECGKQFRGRSEVIVHVRTHTGEKPLVCKYCNKKFAHPSNLKVHERGHRGEKPYKCTFPGCGRKFAHSMSLKDHIYKHTGEYPHKCSTCGKGFRSRAYLSKHLKTHKKGPEN